VEQLPTIRITRTSISFAPLKEVKKTQASVLHLLCQKNGKLIKCAILGKANKRSLVAGDTGMYKKHRVCRDSLSLMKAVGVQVSLK
jgi:hypothetical protein